MMHRTLRSILLIGLVSLMGACFPTDTEPRLEILVLDQSGAPVSGAYAALFETEADWNDRANPVQAWRKTDADGKVLFTDLREIRYYVYARFDSQDNSLGENSTVTALQINRVTNIAIHIR